MSLLDALLVLTPQAIIGLGLFLWSIRAQRCITTVLGVLDARRRIGRLGERETE